MKTLRESSLKLLKNRRKRVLKSGEVRYSEVDETELKIFLTAVGVRCDMCNTRLTYQNLGYLRVGDGVELALCEKCLIDYVEYLEEMRRAVATE
ncbi:hypothetical protein P186_2749 [Pyrobaculum ferrireducens]|uniref:Uncharacterized protein n=1 Tax=Pyrobaculum ferrireducens TaxID=1104324 RepID=G7VEW1_9CREN|nr:hypothetical protein P186_2749 [Pyrobaculum ferrireducens]